MVCLVIHVMILWSVCQAKVLTGYKSAKLSRSTLSGLEEYRSILTLDRLSAEDRRQRKFATAYETEAATPLRSVSSDCMEYPKPATGKIARLILELLKDLEGDETNVLTELGQALLRAKLLVETSSLDAEPNLHSLVETPKVMMGEPHTTFPRIITMLWMSITDPVTTKKFGWCPLLEVNKYLSVTKSVNVAKKMRSLEPIITRARYILDEFIQHMTPINLYQRPKSLRRGNFLRTLRRPLTKSMRTVVRKTVEPDALHAETAILAENRIVNEATTEKNIIVAERELTVPSFSPDIKLANQLLLSFGLFVIINM